MIPHSLRVYAKQYLRTACLLGCFWFLSIASGVAQDIRPEAIQSETEDLTAIDEDLINKLQDPNPLIRGAAVGALGQIGSEEAVELLIEILNSSDSLVHLIAIDALGQAGSEAAVGPLIEQLNDYSDSEHRRAAAEALGQIGSEAAIAPLIRAMYIDWDTEVRHAAIWALVAIDPEAAVYPLMEVIRGLYIPGLVLASPGNPYSLTRREAEEALNSIGSVAFAPLIEVVLVSEDSQGRSAAIRALLNHSPEAALDTFIEALNDSDFEVRRRAAEALGQISSETVHDPFLIGVVFDGSGSQIRQEMLPPLIEAVKDSNAEVRYAAVRALGQIGSEVAVAPLVETLSDSDSEVRYAAVRALGQIGSEVAVAPLVETLSDSDSEVRRQAAWALGQIGSEVAVAPLVETLSDSDSEVRRQAAWALGQIGSEVAVAPLVETLSDSDSEVRRQAAWALGQIGSEVAVAPLVETLSDSDSEVRSKAVWALRLIGSEATVAPLVGVLKDSYNSIGTRRVIIGLLQWHQDLIATQALVEQLSSSQEIPINRYSAIEALSRRHHLQNLANSIELLSVLSNLALQKEENPTVRYGAFLLLSSVSTAEANSLLDANEADFLALVEDNYEAPLPFYLPEPLGSTQSDPINPFDDPYAIAANPEILFGVLPFDDLQNYTIHLFPQGAKPGETQLEVAERLDKPAVCRFPWVARNWDRCK